MYNSILDYYLFFNSLRWFTARADIISVFLSTSCVLYIVVTVGSIPSDFAGASVSLALQARVFHNESFLIWNFRKIFDF